jgi:hypothetical protein
VATIARLHGDDSFYQDLEVGLEREDGKKALKELIEYVW